jgi:hypothetical protein
MVNKVFEKRIGRNIDPHDRVLLVDLEDKRNNTSLEVREAPV